MPTILDAISPKTAVDMVVDGTSRNVSTLTTHGQSSVTFDNPMMDTVVNVTSKFLANLTTLSQSLTAFHNPTSSWRKPIEWLIHDDISRPIARATTDRAIKSATTSLTSTDQPHRITERLKVFSFDILDTKEFQDRVAHILAGHGPTHMSMEKTNIGTTVAYINNTSDLTHNLGFLIPVAIFALFLMFVGVCLLRHGLHKSIYKKKTKKFILSNFYRSQSGWESTRASTKSTTALQFEPKVSNVSQREFVPRLDRISESPEDRFLNISRCDSSLESLMSQLQHDLAAMIASNRSLGISPYELMQPPNYYLDASPNYPNLPIPAQAPFSPYHLAWMTPSVKSMGPPGMMKGNNRNTSNNDTSVITDVKGTNRSVWKSPFHPNYNTPTNGENDSGTHLSNVFVNQVGSMSLLPEVRNGGMKSFISASEPQLMNSSNHLSITPQLAKCSRSSSADAVWVATPSTDCILSGKSNLGSWRYNNLYVKPPSGVPLQGQRLFPTSNADRCALDKATIAHNSSLNANVGTRNPSMIQPLEVINGSTSLPDLPNRFSHGGCPLYQADLARYLHYEFSHFNPAPPYEASPSHMAHQLSSLNSNSSSCKTNSANNTSICAHIDSLETRTTSSAITGQTSHNTSGYMASQSHCTSVAGFPTGQNMLGVPLSNSSLISDSISSIMPVNSGATHNTPNTSFSNNSIYSKSIKEGANSHHRLKPNKTSTANTSLESQNMMSQSFNVSPAVAKSSVSTESIAAASLPYDEASSNHSSCTSHATLSSAVANQSQHTTAPDSTSMQWDSISVGATSMGASSGSATPSEAITQGPTALGVITPEATNHRITTPRTITAVAATPGATTPGATSIMANEGSHKTSINRNSARGEKTSGSTNHAQSIMTNQGTHSAYANMKSKSLQHEKSSSTTTTTPQPSSVTAAIGLRRGGFRATKMSLHWDTYPYYKSHMSGPRRKSPIRIEPGNTGLPPKRPLSKPSGPDASGLITQYWV